MIIFGIQATPTGVEVTPTGVEGTPTGVEVTPTGVEFPGPDGVVAWPRYESPKSTPHTGWSTRHCRIVNRLKLPGKPTF
jgi:hypothetical protein